MGSVVVGILIVGYKPHIIHEGKGILSHEKGKSVQVGDRWAEKLDGLVALADDETA